MKYTIKGVALGFLLGSTGVAFAATVTSVYLSGGTPMTAGHVAVATSDGLGIQDGGAAVATSSTLTWTGAQTFGEMHRAVEAVTLTSNNYTVVAADCGKVKTLPTGTTPTVTLPNLNAGCIITFVTTVTKSYHFIGAGGSTIINSQGFFNTRGTAAGDAVSVAIVVPSGSVAVWVASGDLTS